MWVAWYSARITDETEAFETDEDWQSANKNRRIVESSGRGCHPRQERVNEAD